MRHRTTAYDYVLSPAPSLANRMTRIFVYFAFLAITNDYGVPDEESMPRRAANVQNRKNRKRAEGGISTGGDLTQFHGGTSARDDDVDASRLEAGDVVGRYPVVGDQGVDELDASEG